MRCKFIAQTTIYTATDSPSTSAEAGMPTPSCKQYSAMSFGINANSSTAAAMHHATPANNAPSTSVAGFHRNRLGVPAAVAPSVFSSSTIPPAARCSRSADGGTHWSASPLISAFAIFNLLLTFHAANGYVVGRLLTLQQDEFPAAKNYMFTPSNKSARDIANEEREVTNVRLARDVLGVQPARGPYTEITPEMLYEAFRDIIAKSVNAENFAWRRRSKIKRRVTAASYPLGDSSGADVATDSITGRKNTVSLELLRQKYPRNLRDLQIKRATQKKSALKSLKKFSSNSARNCFFTPIQCMIHHDMSKYKKLIENNSDSFTTAKMR